MKLPRRQQQKIYCMCRSIKHITAENQSKIVSACNSTGFGDAVLEYITTDATSDAICDKYGLNHKLLAVKTAVAFRTIAKTI